MNGGWRGDNEGDDVSCREKAGSAGAWWTAAAWIFLYNNAYFSGGWTFLFGRSQKRHRVKQAAFRRISMVGVKSQTASDVRRGSSMWATGIGAHCFLCFRAAEQRTARVSALFHSGRYPSLKDELFSGISLRIAIRRLMMALNGIRFHSVDGSGRICSRITAARRL